MLLTPVSVQNATNPTPTLAKGGLLTQVTGEGGAGPRLLHRGSSNVSILSSAFSHVGFILGQIRITCQRWPPAVLGRRLVTPNWGGVGSSS